MSSSAQATSSSSNVQLIIEVALADYTKITGTNLSKIPFATALEQSNSPKAILQLLHEQEKGFKECCDGNRRLINCLTLAVTILQAFLGILGTVTQVSHTCHPVTRTLLTHSFSFHLDHAAALTYITEKVWEGLHSTISAQLLCSFRQISERERAKFI